MIFVTAKLQTKHVPSDHVRAAQRDLPPHLASTPRMVNAVLDQGDWSELGETAVD